MAAARQSLAAGLECEVELDFINDSQNRPLTRELSFTPLEINFEDGSRLALDVTPTYERLEEDFEIHDGIVLPAGAVYEFTDTRSRGRLPTTGWWPSAATSPRSLLLGQAT